MVNVGYECGDTALHCPLCSSASIGRMRCLILLARGCELSLIVMNFDYDIRDDE